MFKVYRNSTKEQYVCLMRVSAIENFFSVVELSAGSVSERDLCLLRTLSTVKSRRASYAKHSSRVELKAQADAVLWDARWRSSACGAPKETRAHSRRERQLDSCAHYIQYIRRVGESVGAELHVQVVRQSYITLRGPRHLTHLLALYKKWRIGSLKLSCLQYIQIC